MIIVNERHVVSAPLREEPDLILPGGNNSLPVKVWIEENVFGVGNDFIIYYKQMGPITDAMEYIRHQASKDEFTYEYDDNGIEDSVPAEDILAIKAAKRFLLDLAVDEELLS